MEMQKDNSPVENADETIGIRGWKAIADGELAVLSKNVRTARTWEEVKHEATPFIGRNIENLETGFIASVSKHSLDKMLHKNSIFNSVSDETHYTAVGNLDKLFRLATSGTCKVTAKEKRLLDIATMYQFDVPMPFDGEVLHMKLLIKESKSQTLNLHPIYAFQSIAVAFISNGDSESSDG